MGFTDAPLARINSFLKLGHKIDVDVFKIS